MLTAQRARHLCVALARFPCTLPSKYTQLATAADCLLSVPVRCQSCYYRNRTEPSKDNAKAVATVNGKQTAYEIRVKTVVPREFRG